MHEDSLSLKRRERRHDPLLHNSDSRHLPKIAMNDEPRLTRR